MQSILDNEPGHETWTKIAPLLDRAIARLREKDRQAILMRFYEGQSLRDIGLALGASEFAVDRRIHRALEKLRLLLAKRGVASTSATLSATMTTHSVQTAPAGLAKTISAVALTHSAAASTSTLTLIKGTLKIMAWTKAKTAIVVGAVLILTPTATVMTVKEYQKYRAYSWQTEEYLRSSSLGKAPPMQKIVSTKFPSGGGGAQEWDTHPKRWIGLGYTMREIFSTLYPIQKTRIIFPTPEPKEKFDYISTSGRDLMLAEIRKQIGLEGTLETVDTNVFLLVVKNPNARGFKSPAIDGSFVSRGNGELEYKNGSLANLADGVEEYLGTPVIDKTGQTNHYDFKLGWNANKKSKENLKQALSKQFGLELVPTNMPIEMLMVDKAK